MSNCPTGGRGHSLLQKCMCRCFKMQQWKQYRTGCTMTFSGYLCIIRKNNKNMHQTTLRGSPHLISTTTIYCAQTVGCCPAEKKRTHTPQEHCCRGLVGSVFLLISIHCAIILLKTMTTVLCCAAFKFAVEHHQNYLTNSKDLCKMTPLPAFPLSCFMCTSVFE